MDLILQVNIDHLVLISAIKSSGYINKKEDVINILF